MVCIQTRDDRPSETDTGKLASRASAATHCGAAIHWLHRVALRVSTDLQAASFYSTSQAYRAFSKAEIAIMVIQPRQSLGDRAALRGDDDQGSGRGSAVAQAPMGLSQPACSFLVTPDIVRASSPSDYSAKAAEH